MNQQAAGRPNFLVIVVDDLGYSDIEPSGGEISTPVLRDLADSGARFRNFHTSSLCAPTRSMLLTGCDNHQAGLGVMQPMHSMNQYMQPGYEGFLNHSVPTMAEMLRAGGYHTYMSGKWHLGIPQDTWPAARGFERSYAFLGGGASHFHDATPLSAGETLQTRYVEDDQPIQDLPEDFYSSRTYVDKMIEYTSSQDDDKPFLAYLAFTAPHDPLQVPDEWLDRYRGRYDGGYDAVRGPRLTRMKELGLQGRVPHQAHRRLRERTGAGRHRAHGADGGHRHLAADHAAARHRRRGGGRAGHRMVAVHPDAPADPRRHGDHALPREVLRPHPAVGGADQQHRPLHHPGGHPAGLPGGDGQPHAVEGCRDGARGAAGGLRRGLHDGRRAQPPQGRRRPEHRPARHSGGHDRRLAELPGPEIFVVVNVVNTLGIIMLIAIAKTLNGDNEPALLETPGADMPARG